MSGDQEQQKPRVDGLTLVGVMAIVLVVAVRERMKQGYVMVDMQVRLVEAGGSQEYVDALGTVFEMLAILAGGVLALWLASVLLSYVTESEHVEQVRQKAGVAAMYLCPPPLLAWLMNAPMAI